MFGPVRRKRAGERPVSRVGILLVVLLFAVLALAAWWFLDPRNRPPPPQESVLAARLADIAPVVEAFEVGAEGWAVGMPIGWTAGDAAATKAFCQRLSTRLGRSGDRTVTVSDIEGRMLVVCR